MINLFVLHVPWPEIAPADLYSIIILAVFAALFAIEVRSNRCKYSMEAVLRAYRANVCTWLFNDTVLSLLSVSSLYLAAEHFSGSGLLAKIPHPFWQAAAALALYDLTLYFWHRLEHASEWLWTFHKAHHSDRLMNVSTAFRVHVVELLLTCAVKTVFIAVTGINFVLLLIVETLITINVMFHHTNLRFRGERRLGWVLVSPHLHRLHHSVVRSEHDTNYGALFSLWDRIFGTFAELEPHEIGLRNVPVHGFWELLKFGFNPAANAPAAPDPHSIPVMIAEAAYYRAEKRNFAPGFDMFDWFEAEKEIMRRISKNRKLQHG